MSEWQHKLLAYLRERRRVMLHVDTDDVEDETELAEQFRETLEMVPEVFLSRVELLLLRLDDRWAEIWARAVVQRQVE